MPKLPFPRSSTPGHGIGEGEGRLVNAYVEKAGDTYYQRRVPGLVQFTNGNPGLSGPRGMANGGGIVFAVYATGVVAVGGLGNFTVFSGSIPGTDGVTIAHNNKTPAFDVVAVRESGGAYILTGSNIVTPYPDPDLPATVNSVSFMDGYFVFTIADGRIMTTGITGAPTNTTSIDPLSFATAESRPDGLKRGITHGGVFWAMGDDTIEPWLNPGDLEPFPFTRGASVVPVGLLTTMAVAGFEEGWGESFYFVGHDGTVRQMAGYDAKVVSTPDVERFIASSAKSSLEASVYTFRGHSIWSLSSDTGTWEYNVTSGAWHERKSPGQVRWRASRSLKLFDKWIVADSLSGALYQVTDAVKTEGGTAITWTVESAPLKDYPSRVAIPELMADFTEADANVDVSWSHDGGKSWIGPVTRSLSTASKWPVRVNRLGMATHHGLRARFSVTDDADFSLMGASVPKPAVRAP